MNPDELYDAVLKALIEELKRASATQTQQQIAKLCHTTQATIQRILKGKRGKGLRLRTIFWIAHGLGLDLQSLLACPSDDKAQLQAMLAKIAKMIERQ